MSREPSVKIIRTPANRIDFTQGNIIQSMIAFSVPIVLGELFQNLYNSVDALVVGNFVSENALAAVTVCGTIAVMMINFFNGMSVGSNVTVSRAFGAGDKAELDRAIRVAFTFSTAFGVALSVLGMVFAPELLRFANARPEYYADALSYLRIYMTGLMFTVIYNSGAGILRAIGDSKTPFYILVFACVINIILDVLFVARFRLGIVGVAVATIISQGVSVVLVYRTINKRQAIRCLDPAGMLRGGKDIIASVLSIGVAAGVQSALIGFSNLFIVRYMNLFDTASVAGIGVAQRLDRFVLLPSKAFGLMMTTYVSQNIGAARYDRVRQGKNRCLLLCVSVTVAIGAVVFLFARQMVALFNSDAGVISVGVSMMRILCPLYFIMGIRECYTGVLRGYKKTAIPMVLNILGMVGVRQLYLFVTMSRGIDIRYIYWCYPIAWSATLAMLLVYYAVIKNRLEGLGKKQPREP